MKDKELMTKAEIHDFGVEIVFGCLKKEGYEIIDVNTDISKNPQIIANKDGKLCFIVVRTDCYPEKGRVSTEAEFFKILEHAKSHNATPYFASVGICYADAKDEKEAGIPYKGAGFASLYNGLLIMSAENKVGIVE